MWKSVCHQSKMSLSIFKVQSPTYMTMAEFFIILPHGPNC